MNNRVRKTAGITKKQVNYIIWILLSIPGTLFVLIILSVIASLLFYSKPEIIISNIISEEILFAVFLSLSSSILSTFCCMIVAIPTAYLIIRNNNIFLNIIDVIIELPVAFPPLVAGVGLLILFGPILGNALAKIGLKFVFTFQGIILSQFFVAAPFSIKMMKATYQEIDSRYEIVARTLKARPYEIFFRITLPLAKKGILGMISLTWARVVGEFGATMMLVGATRLKTETLPNAIFLNMTDGNLDMVIAISIIFLILGASVLFLYKLTSLSLVE